MRLPLSSGQIYRLRKIVEQNHKVEGLVSDQEEDLLSNVEIENDEVKLLAEYPIHAYCAKLLVEHCWQQQ